MVFVHIFIILPLAIGLQESFLWSSTPTIAKHRKSNANLLTSSTGSRVNLMELTFRARVWLYPGPAAWHFITLPKKHAKEIREVFGESARGWGSFPVEATIGSSTWKTSIFPDKKSGSYLLPLKKEVRKKEEIDAEEQVDVFLTIQP